MIPIFTIRAVTVMPTAYITKHIPDLRVADTYLTNVLREQLEIHCLYAPDF
jgi:hypothetical protein